LREQESEANEVWRLEVSYALSESGKLNARSSLDSPIQAPPRRIEYIGVELDERANAGVWSSHTIDQKT
jgi:hypothetical protein